MRIGQVITFFHDTWEGNDHVVKKVNTKILDICYDPLKICQPKCGVEVDGESYGIPFNEILEIAPVNGKQLTLNLM